MLAAPVSIPGSAGVAVPPSMASRALSSTYSQPCGSRSSTSAFVAAAE